MVSLKLSVRIVLFHKTTYSLKASLKHVIEIIFFPCNIQGRKTRRTTPCFTVFKKKKITLVHVYNGSTQHLMQCPLTINGY